MKHYKQLLFILFVLGSVTAYAQDVKVNYSKGNSLLFFDLDSKSKFPQSQLFHPIRFNRRPPLL